MNVVIYHSHYVLLHLQIYSKRNWFKTNHTSKFYFFSFIFIVIDHSIRNKNTRSLKYGTKQIQAY